MFVLIILTSCNSKREESEKEEIEVSSITNIAPMQEVAEMVTTKLTKTSTVEEKISQSEEIIFYPKTPMGFFTYNPDDDFFYVSVRGAPDYGQHEDESYPFDSPEIEQFCKINSKTNEVIKLLDYSVSNLAYSDGYVYFTDGDRLKRIKNDVIEELFTLTNSEWHTTWGIQVENNEVYLMGWNSATAVYDLENMQKIEGMVKYKQETFYQIYDDIIFMLSNDNDKLYWKNAANEENLITDNLTEYTVYNNLVYYIAGDELYKYDLNTKESEMIFSFFENSGVNDYSGYENIMDVEFFDDRCFLIIVGRKSYSYERIIELDLETKEIVYLTDYFDDKINAITSFYGIPFSFEYPNDYSVFIDYGSSAGTLINNYKKRIEFNINDKNTNNIFSRVGREYGENKDALTDITKQGFTIYYNWYGEDVLFASIVNDGKIWISISVSSMYENIREYEEEILNIIKSIHVYEDYEE